MLLSLTSAFDSLQNLVSDSPWTYLLVFGLAAGDVLFPVLPSETVVILAGVLAGTGHLQIGLVFVAAALGAFTGDNICYWVGRTAGTRLAERLLTEERQAQIARAQVQIDERGGYFIVLGRFVPGRSHGGGARLRDSASAGAQVHAVRRDCRDSLGRPGVAGRLLRRPCFRGQSAAGPTGRRGAGDARDRIGGGLAAGAGVASQAAHLTRC